MSTSPASSRAAVDFRAAQRRARAIASPGPRAERAELVALVAQLRDAAHRAPSHVGRVTGLHDAAAQAATGPVYVIDRARWAEANIGLFSHLVGDLLPASTMPGGGRLAGEELGALLGLLSTKVLGQFDPFTPPEQFGGTGDGPGRLVLVAPNVLHVERELRLDPTDFRLWVCLHEQTHAVQFAAAPWLADHLADRVRELVTGIDALGRDGDRWAEILASLPRALRGRAAPGPDAEAAPGPDAAPGTGPDPAPDAAPDPGVAPTTTASGGGALLDVVLDEEGRALVADVVAVMSLLEGHADVVMDAVGRGVIPSLRRIRSTFEARRDGRGAVDILLRRVLGLDAKIAQYRTGAAFVRGVVGAVGHGGLNAVWSAPTALPSPAEIADPAAWVRRVHG